MIFARPPRKANQHFKLELVAALLVLFTLSATGFAADTLTGTATNKTTGKPAGGDEVVLIKLSQGMEEGPHAKTNGKGEFTRTAEYPPDP